jgi:SulP family sulfate permease
MLSFPDAMYDMHIVGISSMYGVNVVCTTATIAIVTPYMLEIPTICISYKNKETIGQGVANTIVALFGGYGGSALVGQSRFNATMGATSIQLLALPLVFDR